MRCWVIKFTFVSHGLLGTGWQNLILHYVMLHKTGSRELWTVIHTYSICGCTLSDNEREKRSLSANFRPGLHSNHGLWTYHKASIGCRWCVDKLQCRLHLLSVCIHHTEDWLRLWQGYDCDTRASILQIRSISAGYHCVYTITCTFGHGIYSSQVYYWGCKPVSCVTKCLGSVVCWGAMLSSCFVLF